MYYLISIEQGGKTTTYAATKYEWIQKYDIPYFWIRTTKNTPFLPIEYYIPLNKIDSLSIQEV